MWASFHDQFELDSRYCKNEPTRTSIISRPFQWCRWWCGNKYKHQRRRLLDFPWETITNANTHWPLRAWPRMHCIMAAPWLMLSRARYRERFEKYILPSFFKMTKYTSFRRQLNLWGFKRLVHKTPDFDASTKSSAFATSHLCIVACNVIRTWERLLIRMASLTSIQWYLCLLLLLLSICDKNKERIC
jgi:hypothetical protein